MNNSLIESGDAVMQVLMGNFNTGKRVIWLRWYFHLTRQHLKYHSSFDLLINNWRAVGMIWARFRFPYQVQFGDFWFWILVSFVPTNFIFCTFFAFVTFSALLFCLYLWILPYFKKYYVNNHAQKWGGHLKECLGTSRIDKFAKLKAQPAKKCLLFSFLQTVAEQRSSRDSFSLLCTNIEINQSFHCRK